MLLCVFANDHAVQIFLRREGLEGLAFAVGEEILAGEDESIALGFEVEYGLGAEGVVAVGALIPCGKGILGVGAVVSDICVEGA